MLHVWAKGECPTVAIWRLAHAIVRIDESDCGHAVRRIADLANMGTPGSQKNCTRKLLELLAETALNAMVLEVPHERGEYHITHHLPPSNVIKMIFSYNRKKFGTIFGADKVKLKRFWSDLFSSDEGKEFQRLHPNLTGRTPEELETSIPFIVHEDAAPYGKKSSVNVLQWGPLLTHGSDIESRFVHHNYIAKKGAPAETARKAWNIFWKEVEHMAHGCDIYGNRFARDEDGTVWKFIFTFSLSDFDMDREHGLPNFNRGELFCKHCKATNFGKAVRDKYPFADVGPNALWRDQLVTDNNAFKQRLNAAHPLTDSKYFNKYTCRNDLMHCMDHHGVWSVIFASVLLYLILNDGVPTLGDTQQRRLDTINGLLTRFYHTNIGITARLDKLTMANIRPGGARDWCALGGPTVKAANTRQAMPFLDTLAKSHLKDSANYDHLLMHVLID